MLLPVGCTSSKERHNGGNPANEGAPWLVGIFDTYASFVDPSRLIANHEKEEWINGEKTEDIVAFLDRPTSRLVLIVQWQ